jgi:YgiT-type zinc finger domain-containing protein
MNCLICRQAEIVPGFTSILLEREEFRLLFDQVPAQICPNCAEAVVSEDVAIQLLTLAEDAVADGVNEGSRNYSL